MLFINGIKINKLTQYNVAKKMEAKIILNIVNFQQQCYNVVDGNNSNI